MDAGGGWGANKGHPAPPHSISKPLANCAYVCVCVAAPHTHGGNRLALLVVEPVCARSCRHPPLPLPRSPPDLEALAGLCVFELKVLWEAAGQAAPDAVRVQLKGLANLLNLQPQHQQQTGSESPQNHLTHAGPLLLLLMSAPPAHPVCQAPVCTSMSGKAGRPSHTQHTAHTAHASPLTSLQACWMIFAPVFVTTPAISMLYQRAPLRIT